MIKVDMNEVNRIVFTKLLELRKTHGAFGNFSYCRMDHKTNELDLMYDSKLIGTLYADDFHFSDVSELQTPLPNIIWDLCIYLQKHYGRGDYSDGQNEHEPKKSMIEWNKDGSMKLLC